MRGVTGFQGEIVAIGAAMVWALATWIYSQFRHRFSALQPNILKGIIASLMMLVLLPLEAQSQLTIAKEHLLILALSGVMGIAVGDSACCGWYIPVLYTVTTYSVQTWLRPLAFAR